MRFLICPGSYQALIKGMPIIRLQLNASGFDDLAYGVLYGVVSGTTNVYRLIGSDELDVDPRIYNDAETTVVKAWHVVLVCATCLASPA